MSAAPHSEDYVQPTMPPAVRGLMVGPITLPDGRCFYAEVEPVLLRYWRPWPHRTSLWWYEVRSTEPDRGEATTWAYDEGGSGGGLTLRACVRRAADAVEQFAIREFEASLSGSPEGDDR